MPAARPEAATSRDAVVTNTISEPVASVKPASSELAALNESPAANDLAAGIDINRYSDISSSLYKNLNEDQAHRRIDDLVRTESSERNLFRGASDNRLNSNLVIRYQIQSETYFGVPIPSYREATDNFFTPEISLARDDLKSSSAANWGYARGAENRETEKLRRLILELELIREK